MKMEEVLEKVDEAVDAISSITIDDVGDAETLIKAAYAIGILRGISDSELVAKAMQQSVTISVDSDACENQIGVAGPSRRSV